MKVAEIEEILMEDRDEGLEHDEICATEAATATCEQIAHLIVPYTIRHWGFRWATFGEDGGVVVLALRSQITRRRVDFRISADGCRVECISIDLRASGSRPSVASAPVSAEDGNALRERVAWVMGGENK